VIQNGVSEDASTTQTTPQLAVLPAGDMVHRLSLVFGPEVSGDLPAIYLDEEGVTLGRDQGPGLWRFADPDVSRRHAKISFSADYHSHRVKDLQSKNGTFVDGRRITDTEALKNGSVMRIGNSLIVYEAVPQDARVGGLNDCPFDVSLARHQVDALADVAATHEDVSILILGPTGSGKEVLARRIHEKSGRAGPMVSLNCATLNKELLSTELFGHKKGAYSGAEQDRAGLFQTASGGTLFLDEIAELPLDQQSALLRVLEEKRVRPVGADREIEVDVRLVCATHQDLARLEHEGRFRSDLLARLDGLTIRIPPLSERRVEILPLFRSFLKASLPLSFDAAHALLLHGWPKNVRALQSAAKQVSMFAGRVERIEVLQLDTNIQRSLREVEESMEPDRPSKEALGELLRKHNGNVTRVAGDLGKQRNQIYRWIEAYQLKVKDFREDLD
jgi:transcriptional regulator of acetoin/glycerol metabolism